MLPARATCHLRGRALSRSPKDMAMPPKRKNISQEYIDDSDDPDDTGERTKKAKLAEAAAATASSDGDLIKLSAKRFVNVRVFKGRHLVDIREYYEDDAGERKPGKKGISLSLDQWEKLKAATPEIDRRIHGT